MVRQDDGSHFVLIPTFKVPPDTISWRWHSDCLFTVMLLQPEYEPAFIACTCSGSGVA